MRFLGFNRILCLMLQHLEEVLRKGLSFLSLIHESLVISLRLNLNFIFRAGQRLWLFFGYKSQGSFHNSIIAGNFRLVGWPILIWNVPGHFCLHRLFWVQLGSMLDRITLLFHVEHLVLNSTILKHFFKDLVPTIFLYAWLIHDSRRLTSLQGVCRPNWNFAVWGISLDHDSLSDAVPSAN